MAKTPPRDLDLDDAGAGRPARLWRAHRSRRRHQTRTVIAKLRAGSEPVRSMAGALAAHRPPAAPTSRLARLVENGYAERIEPVFDLETPPDTIASRDRFLAAAAERTPDLTHARGLVEICVDRGTDPSDLARQIAAMSAEVEYAFVPAIRHVFGGRRAKARRDPLASRQWGHGAVRIAYARQARHYDAASGITVAIVDTGIDASHPDLADAIIGSRNFVTTEQDRDLIGHGTHVAGIISAGLENGIGISGLSAARILALKALPLEDDDWDAKAYYRALRYTIGRAQVLNLSLGGDRDDAELDILRDVIAAGIVVIAAMGNEYEEGNPIEYPAAMKAVCAVGATDQLDRRASFSNTGRHIDLCAPGVEILSTTPTYAYEEGRRNYDSWDGTSMATPHVAAAAALILARSPGLTPAKVITRLTSTADRLSGMRGRPDTARGWGRLNIEAALR